MQTLFGQVIHIFLKMKKKGKNNISKHKKAYSICDIIFLEMKKDIKVLKYLWKH